MEQPRAVGRQTVSLPLSADSGPDASDRLVMSVAPLSAGVVTLNRQ